MSKKERYHKPLQYQFRDRKEKKRRLRRSFIQTVNVECRKYGLTYSSVVNRLLLTGILLNRKTLYNFVLSEPKTFRAIMQIV